MNGDCEGHRMNGIEETERAKVVTEEDRFKRKLEERIRDMIQAGNELDIDAEWILTEVLGVSYL